MDVRSQRWRDRRSSYRPADDERFDPSHHEVVLVAGDNEVRPFVVAHHYAASLPNSGRFRFLLLDTSAINVLGQDTMQKLDSLIIQRAVIYATPASDITNEVLTLMNNEYEAGAAAAPDPKPADQDGP